MSTQEISNFDDVIDSRDVIARIEELEQHIEDCTSVEPEEPCEDERKELATLGALAEEGAQYAPDWEYGATLIRESYFQSYCEELVSDIGDLPKDTPAYLVIDWEATARNLKVDYTEVDFDGVAYLIR